MKKPQKVHIFAIQMRERHTRENVFDAIYRLSSAVIGKKWSQKLICISTDEVSSKMGLVREAVTSLEQVFSPGVY